MHTGLHLNRNYRLRYLDSGRPVKSRLRVSLPAKLADEDEKAPLPEIKEKSRVYMHVEGCNKGCRKLL